MHLSVRVFIHRARLKINKRRLKKLGLTPKPIPSCNLSTIFYQASNFGLEPGFDPVPRDKIHVQTLKAAPHGDYKHLIVGFDDFCFVNFRAFLVKSFHRFLVDYFIGYYCWD